MQTSKTSRRFRQLALAASATALAAAPVWAQAQEQAGRSPKKPDYPLTLADQGYFFVNGHYVVADSTGAEHIMTRQMYVSFKVPQRVTQRYPVVMIHGGGQTGTNFEGTPDGREGWADFFVARGYKVYVVDQPGRGRSAYHPNVYGPINAISAEFIEQRFTAFEDFNLWPQAHLHTQWPDGSRQGSPIFDQFYASQVESISDAVLTERLNQAAGAALLDTIGPAIVLTHSQSGAFGWLIADARPKFVKGIIAIEPAGPPFEAVIIGTGKTRPWGLTDIKMTYDPPASSPDELQSVREDKAEGPDLTVCTMQKAPARQLPNLKGIPIVVIAGEASYHKLYDHCTVKYLNQAGAKAEWMPLDSKGIRGNGHMVMIEKNNLEIAKVIDDWAKKNVK
jgi:pimeloyl-ACP methyl ester carboxylesterase